jgi:hypothetical protein
MKRFFFPSHPGFGLLLITLVVAAVTPSIDPVTLTIVNAPSCIAYMFLWFRYRHREQRKMERLPESSDSA